MLQRLLVYPIVLQTSLSYVINAVIRIVVVKTKRSQLLNREATTMKILNYANAPGFIEDTKLPCKFLLNVMLLQLRWKHSKMIISNENP